MKRAQLHDGTILEFPPETQQDVIDRAVRENLGLPEPVDKDEMRAGQMQELVIKAVNLLAGRLDELAAKVDRLIEVGSVPMPEIPPFPQPVDMMPAFNELASAVRDANSRIIQAVTAPREVVTPDGRRFTSSVKAERA